MRISKTSVALLVIQLVDCFYGRREVSLSALDLSSRLGAHRGRRSGVADAGALPEPATDGGWLPEHAAFGQGRSLSARYQWRGRPGPVFCAGFGHLPCRSEGREQSTDGLRIEDDQNGTLGQEVSVWPGAACDAMRLDAPVDFYIAEHAQSPLPLKPGQELWIEVTVPPKGPPRPTQLALKDNSAWKPLAFQ